MSHPVRLAILQVLEQQEARTGELAQRLGISVASARHHVQSLRDGGLVRPGESRGGWRACHRGWAEIAGLLATVAGDDRDPGGDAR